MISVWSLLNGAISMEYTLSLIDKAGEKCGSFYQLAKIAGTYESAISSMRAGNRPVPMSLVPILAEIAGVDVHEAIDRVMIEQEKNPKRRGQLVEILGKAVAAGVAGMLVFSYSSDSISTTVTEKNSTSDLRMYTSWNIARLIWRLIFAHRARGLTTV